MLATKDGDFTNKVRIEWNASPLSTYYLVSRDNDSDPNNGIEAISPLQTSIIFDYTGATPGVDYYFRVQGATSSSGDTISNYSDYDIGWRALSPPVVSAADGSVIEVSWLPAEGASAYRLYRNTTSDFNTSTPITNWVSDLSYTDNDIQEGNYYYYWVKSAVDLSGYRASGVGTWVRALALEDPAIPVSLPLDAEGAPDDVDVMIPVSIDQDVTGLDIIAVQFDITYDPDIITLTNTSVENTLTEGWVITLIFHTPGHATLNGFNIAEMQGEGTMINLLFDVLGNPEETSVLALSDFHFNEGVPEADPHDGLFTVRQNRFDITGTVNYRTGLVPLANTSLALTGTNTFNFTTDGTGVFLFSQIITDNYTLTPSKTDEVNGITIFDAARIAQYCASLYTFDLYQIIAADVTGDGTVSPFDAAITAMFAGGGNHGSRAGTWAFNPNSRSYLPLQNNMSNQDFLGILYGEVTNNWVSSAARIESKNAELETMSVLAITTDNTSTIELESIDDVIAFQFEIQSTTKPEVQLSEKVPADWMVLVNQTSENLWFVGAYGITPLSDNQILKMNSPNTEIISGLINETPIQVEKTYTSLVGIPTSTTLRGAYPNPFNPRTTISYDLSTQTQVTLSIYNTNGQLIGQLVNTNQSAGSYHVEWNGTNEQGKEVESGIYFYRLETADYTDTKSMILLK